MLIPGGEVSSGETLRDDVCIIGGGVAGLTMASALAMAGRSVTLLESGGIDDDPAKADLSDGENVGQKYEQLASGRYRRFGGSSHLWNIDLGEGEVGPRLQPLRSLDFEQRGELRDIGWPFSYEDLEPCYQQAYRFLGLGRFPDEVAAWSDARHPLLPLDRSVVETALFRFIPRRRFSEELPQELSSAPGVRVLLDSTVTELTSRPGSAEVESVRVMVGPGHEFAVSARTFVLAAGTLEGARLLLASRSAHPNGLGNDFDQVGRYFLEHPHFCAGWIVPRDRRLLERVALYRTHRNAGRPVMAKLRLSEETLEREGLLDYCVGLKPVWRSMPSDGVRALLHLRGVDGKRSIARLPAALRDAIGDIPGIVRYSGQRVRERSGRPLAANVIKLNAMTEQAPNAESRVKLADRRDSLGQQRVRLDWRLGAGDEESARLATEVLGAEVRRSGLGYVVPHPEPFAEVAGGWHHMGGTRMHSDPRQGVVDADGKLHGSPNLFVAGSSVFPTAGYANPTLTIVALSLRLAEHLERREAPVPVATLGFE